MASRGGAKGESSYGGVCGGGVWGGVAPGTGVQAL